jgi:ankyrin repeat protein
MKAACNGDVETCERLLTDGAKPNDSDEVIWLNIFSVYSCVAQDGRTALYWAASGGHELVVETLLSVGADTQKARKAFLTII